jgi:hypothetical protein
VQTTFETSEVAESWKWLFQIFNMKTSAYTRELCGPAYYIYVKEET